MCIIVCHFVHLIMGKMVYPFQLIILKAMEKILAEKQFSRKDWIPKNKVCIYCKNVK